MDPEAGAFADSGELCGLVVCVAEAGKGAVAKCELGEFVNYGGEFGEEEVEPTAQEDEVGVVGAVARGSYGGCKFSRELFA